MNLASRRDNLPWTERYRVVKTNLKTSDVPGWREQLLHLGKKSLKLEEDKLATKYCQDLKSFEEYINSSYLLNVDVLDDLFSQIKNKSPPKSWKKSLQNLQQISIILQTINQRKLGHKFSERHYEILIAVGLTKSDQIEFRKEIAKKKSTTVTSSTLLEESEDESEVEEEDVDFDKS